MSDIALTVSILALVAVVGLFIGNVKFRGVGLGIGGVLFGGIIVGHFVSQAGMTLSSDMLHVIQEFGSRSCATWGHRWRWSIKWG